MDQGDDQGGQGKGMIETPGAIDENRDQVDDDHDCGPDGRHPCPGYEGVENDRWNRQQGREFEDIDRESDSFILSENPQETPEKEKGNDSEMETGDRHDMGSPRYGKVLSHPLGNGSSFSKNQRLKNWARRWSGVPVQKGSDMVPKRFQPPSEGIALPPCHIARLIGVTSVS